MQYFTAEKQAVCEEVADEDVEMADDGNHETNLAADKPVNHYIRFNDDVVENRKC